MPSGIYLYVYIGWLMSPSTDGCIFCIWVGPYIIALKIPKVGRATKNTVVQTLSSHHSKRAMNQTDQTEDDCNEAPVWIGCAAQWP